MVTMKTLILRHHHHHTNQWVTSWLIFCSVSDKNALTVQHYCKASQRSNKPAVDCMFLDDWTHFFFSPNALLIQYICHYNVVIEHSLSFFNLLVCFSCWDPLWRQLAQNLVWKWKWKIRSALIFLPPWQLSASSITSTYTTSLKQKHLVFHLSVLPLYAVSNTSV